MTTDDLEAMRIAAAACTKQRSGVPSHPLIDFDDLYQEGWLALQHATTAYTPAKGTTWQTYRGKMLHWKLQEAIREGLPYPRTWKILWEGPPANEAEQAALLDTLARLRKTGWGCGLVDPSTAPVSSPEDLLLEKDLQERLRAVLPQLPARERYLITQKYWYGRSLRDIGHDFYSTEGRMCQIHRQALAHLRALLDEA
jgi:RNA polymerase sigma factor (sigma-70 family)